MPAPDSVSDYDVLQDYTAILSECDNREQLIETRARLMSDNRLTLVGRTHMAGMYQIKIDKLESANPLVDVQEWTSKTPAAKGPPPAKARSKTVTEGFAPADIDAGVRTVKEKSKESLIVTDASKTYNVPPGFILVFTDLKTGRMSPYVTKDGMLWKLKHEGFRSVVVEIVPDPDHAGGFLGTATITPSLSTEDIALLGKILDAGMEEEFRRVYEDLMRPTVSHSSANSGNLKEKQLPWAREMCETRAILRVARVFTGCGISLPDADEEMEALTP